MDKNHNINFCYQNRKIIDTIRNNWRNRLIKIRKENFRLLFLIIMNKNLKEMLKIW
jgi:hypothetical protein